MPIPRPPKDLKDRGRRLWRSFVEDLELTDAELAVLLEACRTADLVERLADELAGADLTVDGSRGQLIVHPVAAELRQQRALLAQLLARLTPPPEEDDDSAAAVRLGKRGAAARWYGRR